MIATKQSELEHELAVRVIDTLLREDYGGLSRRIRRRDGGPVLELPAADGSGSVHGSPMVHGGAGLVLPLERDGFLADFRVIRTPAAAGGPSPTLGDLESVLSEVSDPLDKDGVAAFTAECREALATLRLRERHLPDVWARLAQLWLAPDALSGPQGLLAYEALAAAMPHPAYPTSESRLGFSEDDSLRYAPEYRPEFELHWIAVPRSRLVAVGGHDDRPVGWPTAPEVGLPKALTATHDLMPVHPATARHELDRALIETGLADQVAIAPVTGLRVTPTLSTRTVCVTGEPRSHIKLPLPTSTLGLLNRRFIKPGTLADGALVRDILAAAAQDDPLLDGLLLADESTYAHAGHHYLGYLLRRLPAGLDRCRIVPVPALLAPSPVAAGAGRPLVIDELAGWARYGDLLGLFGAYLELLFGVHVRLFARYGIALEAHQQNTALVLGPPGESARLRLLVKDFDGTLIHLPRLAAALGDRALGYGAPGHGAPDESAFTDPRLVTRSDDALADVFITITVHLCAGALAFGLADRGAAPLPDLLALVRRKLTAALDDHAGWPAASALRARVLGPDRLPGKSMVTAGTLVAKSRTGASDINKFYGTNGPNYLKVLPT